MVEILVCIQGDLCSVLDNEVLSFCPCHAVDRGYRAAKVKGCYLTIRFFIIQKLL